MSAPTAPGTALRAVQLTKSYPGGRGADPVRALDGLSLEVGRGSLFALLGPNGAGKSTTVKILSTLARADAGQAWVDGVDVHSAPARVRQIIGLVSQKPSAMPMSTGRENLVLTGRIQGLSRSEAGTRAQELLDRFDLAAAADRLAKTYSGGMARKLDVAIGLVHRPRVLFLDEPTTGLDPEARAEMWAEIDRLRAEDGITVLLTTHYLEEADALADRVAIVDHGRIVVEGTPDELKSQLRGDTIQIDLDVPAAAAVPVLDRVPGISAVRGDGNRLRAGADAGARAVPAVLTALDEAGFSVAAVTVARPSLDDVYLRHVGRAFDGAGVSGGAA